MKITKNHGYPPIIEIEVWSIYKKREKTLNIYFLSIKSLNFCLGMVQTFSYSKNII